MLSIRTVSAGSGYEYLLRSVATNDAPSEQHKLSDYYAAKGTPAGRWLGTGLAGFKTDSIISGAEITELQMAALYGEGLHPEADEMVKNGQGLAQTRIGRPFPYYANSVPVLAALRDAERDFRLENDALPSTKERADIALKVGTPFFHEAYGFPPANGREVLDWINNQRQNVKQACAGYDFTFSPVKSISVLWALSDEETANRIAACHHKAVAQTMAWAEEEVIRTRRGAGGIEQVKTKGLIATEFTHFDTRLGDPDLHSHVLVSNKVQDENGKWLSLDGRTIFRFHQSMGFRYNSILSDILTREMGLDFEEHERGAGKESVWEVRGIDPELLSHFSKRRAQARPVYDKMVENYVEKHGVAPSKITTNKLWQKAILDTRDAKRPAESLGTLREQWMEEIRSLNNGNQLLESVNSSLKSFDDDPRRLFDNEDFNTIIDDALSTVIRRRSTFRKSHIHTAVAAKMMAFRFDSAEHRDESQTVIVEGIVKKYGISLNASEPFDLPQQLLKADGSSIDKLLDSDVFTTEEILKAEQNSIDAVVEPVAVFAESALIKQELSDHHEREGWALNSGQEHLAKHLLTSGTLAATGVGPAGTGKTASMKMVASVWTKSGRNVIGLAPSKAAAKILSADINAPAMTIDSLTFVWNGHHPTKPGGDLRSLPVDINPGDMLLVDEAGMASTPNISALIDIARASGAVVRFIGDPKQLDAVENGGLFGAMTRSGSTATLTDVMRFKDDVDQSESSLQIRDGDAAGLDLHFDRGWVVGGAREAMIMSAAQQYIRDVDAGRSSLLLASTNADVSTLNEVIRSARIAKNEVSSGYSVQLSRGEECSVGDTILVRKNAVLNRSEFGGHTRVSNGDLLTVRKITDSGDLIVVDDKTGKKKTLTADFIQEHVQLGYASTVHRAQGANVDVAHAIVDQSIDRAGLYVALTRAKYSTHTYAITEHVLDELAEDVHYHHGGNDAAPTAREVLEKVLKKDNHQLSAMETLWTNIDESESAERKRALWIHGHDLAINQFIAAHLEQSLEELSSHDYQALIETGDGLKPVESAWRVLLESGLDPRPLTQESIHHCDDYRDLGRLLGYKLRQSLPAEPETFATPPHTHLTDAELVTWLEENREDFLHARNESESVATARTFAPGEVISNENFQDYDFRGADLRGVTFEKCALTGAVFDDVSLTEVSFTRCRLDDASFKNATLNAVNFSLSRMENANFDGATLGTTGDYSSKVDFLNVDAPNMSLARTVIHALEATWSYFKNIDLRGSAANFATFIGSNLSGAQADFTSTSGFMSSLVDCETDTDLPIPSSSNGTEHFTENHLPTEQDLPPQQEREHGASL